MVMYTSKSAQEHHDYAVAVTFSKQKMQQSQAEELFLKLAIAGDFEQVKQYFGPDNVKYAERLHQESKLDKTCQECGPAQAMPQEKNLPEVDAQSERDPNPPKGFESFPSCFFLHDILPSVSHDPPRRSSTARKAS